MKKEIKYILFNLLLVLSACGKEGNSNVNSSVSNQTSSTIISSFISNSSYENNIEQINKNASNIIKAQENIAKTANNINNSQARIMKKERNRDKSFSMEGLNGEFLVSPFYDAGALIKMTSEPLSFAFATLEGLIATNNADVDINDKTFYFYNNDSPVRINYLEEYSDYVFIRYADYRMLLNSNEENTFVLSFSTGLNNEMWINYESLSVSVTYWQSDAPWYDEIDALINSFDLYNQDSISGEPLRCIKSIFEKEGNVLEAWKNEGSNILNENEYVYQYMHHHNLREMYFARYDEFLGVKDDIVIEDNKLVKINGLSKYYFLDVPSEVLEISTLTKKYESQKVYAFHLPTSVTKIEKGAFNDLGTELLFVDYLKEEISDELYNMYLESGDNIRILFKDQWTIVHDLYIPSEYYYSILDYNMFNISLKGLMYDFNKIYIFEEFLTHEDFQKYLDLMCEYCEMIINTVEDVNNILEIKVEYFDSVINSISLNADEYCFYYINENNEEVIVDNVNGALFLENDLNIKRIEKVENEDEENKEEEKDDELKEKEKEDEFVEVNK